MENKLIVFLSKHWSKLLLGTLTLACVVAWTERFYRKNTQTSQQDFVVCNQIFERFQKGEALSLEAIESLENIVSHHPELHSKYDGMMALGFFAHSKVHEGAQYAASIMQHVDSELPPLYKDYAAATLLIAQGEFPKAFEASLALDKKVHDQKGYQTLDAMNTLRLVFLADQLKETAQKNVFWKKLEQHPAYATIGSLFQEGKVSLGDYIRNSK